jgi:hypothetical protein
MKKEIILAVILSILVALGITFFIYQKNKVAAPEEASQATPSSTPVDSLPEKETAPVTISFPEHEDVFEDKSITITGISIFPDTPVVIFINQKDFFTQSDNNGHFSLAANLESGSNIIVATIVDNQGKNYSDQVTVIYSNKSLEETLVSEEEIKAEN